MTGKSTRVDAPPPSPQDTKEHEKTLERMYLDERKTLIEGEQESADQFDKHMVTLAGGALGVSIVFIEKIAPHPLPETLKYLYLSWSGLVLSLFVTLSSFLTSQHAYRRQIQILEETIFPKGEPHPNTRNYWARITGWLNWLSILSFVLGVSMLVYFSISNTTQFGFGKKDTKIQQPTNP